MGVEHLLILLFAIQQTEAGSYVVTFPNALIPGVELEVRSLALMANGKILVSAKLLHENNSEITSSNDLLSVGVPVTLKIPVPDDLPESNYKVVVQGSGGLNFRNESNIRYEPNNLFMLVQTDKTRYSGGQEIKYRAILVRPNLKGYQGPLTITIQDGDDNVIEMTSYKTTKEGVISGRLLLSREPVFGLWTITLKALGKVYEKFFEVNDYILPKFRVEITLPDRIRDFDTSFTVSVGARFTFLADVYGNCTIQIYNTDSTTHYVEYHKQIIGKANFTVPMADLKSKLWLNEKINIRAFVTDNATFLTMANEKSLNIEIDKSKLPIIIKKVDSRNYFLPGLIYQTPILVLKNGEPISSTGVVHVTPTETTAQELPCHLNSRPSKWLNITTTTKSSFGVQIDKNGYGVLNYYIGQHVNKIEFKFQSSETITSNNIIVHSGLDVQTTSISLSAQNAVTKVGEKTRITLDSTEKISGFITFEFYSGGMFLKSRTVQVNNEMKVFIDIDVTSNMVPKMYAMATHVTGMGQLIQNYATVIVDGSPFTNMVNVTYNTTLVQPNNGVQMDLIADPNSTVYLLVEDESNRLLGTENDIFSHEVVKYLSKVGNVTNKNSNSIMSEFQDKRVIAVTDYTNFHRTPTNSLLMYNKGFLPTQCSQSILTGTSAVFIPPTTMNPSTTMSTTTTTRRPHFFQHNFAEIPDIFSITQLLNAQNGGGRGGGGGCGKRKRTQYTMVAPLICQSANALHAQSSENLQYSSYKLPTFESFYHEIHQPDVSTKKEQALELKEITRIRFPETWLWEEHNIGVSGNLRVHKSVPDSLTTWITSAFATNKDSGFGISEIKQKITVKKTFFLTTALPTSIVQGEEFLLQITIFNYTPNRQLVQLMIERSDEPTRPSTASASVEQNQGHSTFVRIRPQRSGILKITVRARAGFWSTIEQDMLTKEVTVQPQGIKQRTNHQRLIMVNTKDQSHGYSVNLQVSEFVIPSTKSIEAKITGEIMVPTIEGLQNLIELPHGCGEQTMVNLAPDVYLTIYMKSTGQLTKDVEEKALSYIRSGYQRELNFKRYDGSFSIWGNTDSYGSTWLTAYVLKCFYQANELIPIDEEVLSKAMEWLVKKQNRDGSFIENLPVYYVDHLHTSRGLKLTAFSLISIMEANNIRAISYYLMTLGASKDRVCKFWLLKKAFALDNVITKGSRYLEQSLNTIRDAYSLSIVCYALAKARSSSANLCLTLLEGCKLSSGQNGDMIHWTEKTQVQVRRFSKRYKESRAPARDIETTAYALLAYITHGNFVEALPIVKWIVSQRNPSGGFQSTQDTVISIQALTEFSKGYAKQSRQNVQIHLSGKGFSHDFNSSQNNRHLLHTHEIPTALQSLDIITTGYGLAIIDIVQSFYVQHVEQNTNYLNISATIQQESLNSLTIRPVLGWNGVYKSGMLIIAVEVPTGFIADEDFLKKQSLIRRQETNGRQVDLYFDGVNPGQTIYLNVKMDRSDPVVGNQACYIKAYDYYEPEKFAMTKYESGVLKRADICDVCPACNMCTESTVNQIGVGR